MMLLLLLYSARKHVRWLKFLGPTVAWFRYHMILGVLGPLCILYHSNFGLGATNSNVALFSMLTVAGSGLIGRYIYARIHHGLYGSKLSLGELKTGADGLRAHSGAFGFLPQLVTRLVLSEQNNKPATPLVTSAQAQAVTSQPELYGGQGVEVADTDPQASQPPPGPPPIQPAATPSSVPTGINLQQLAAQSGKTTNQILDELQKRQLQQLDDQSATQAQPPQ